MLNSLRQYATGWVAQLLLGILVLSFSVWGVSDIFTGFRSNEIARVGSTDITAVEFQRNYDTAVRGMSQRVGKALTPDEAQQLGIPQQVIAQLVSAATLDNNASGMGLGLSNDMLSQKILNDPQ